MWSTKMGKERTGSVRKIKGKFYARVTYTGSDGKRHDLKRRAIDRKDAKRIIKEILEDLETKGEQAIHASRATFNDLADAYKAVKLKPAEYRDDRKIAGMRSLASASCHLDALVSHFGPTLVRSITVGRIEQFKQTRLSQKTKRGKDRKVASVNRELEVLRAMLRFAVCEGLLDKNPFELASAPIISKADEVKRIRVLSRDEEERLLEACGPDTPRANITPLIVAALDTGCRRGELLSLVWSDVSFEARTITIRAMTTKTLTARVVPLSTRLSAALSALREDAQLQRLYNERSDSPATPVASSSVFGMADYVVEHAWESACDAARIEDLRFHDLRATFATRLIEAGMAIEQVAKITGHTQLSTLYAHYIRNTASAVERAASLLDSING
jgi:integrase